jgi:effector-binding domain-containing protein
MIEPIAVEFHEGVAAAVIHIHIPRDKIKEVMGPAIQEVREAVVAQGIGPAGPLFAHHLICSDAEFDFDVGFPVTCEVKPTGRVRPGRLPSTMVAKSTYHGDYEGLHQAWMQFGELAKKELLTRGLKRGSSIWENYMHGPESDPDPTTWRTELYAVLDSVD